MEFHAAVIDIVEKATKCPFFHEGCPFDPQHLRSFDVNLIQKCPAFKEGCPYKSVHFEKLQECPAFKDHKCPFDGKQHIDLSKLQQCPAFKNGCPYVHIHAKVGHVHANMTEHVATQHLAEKATKCPFFSKSHGGCPFAPSHSHSFDLSKIKECPAFQSGCPFKDVHTERLNECPAFKDGKCPFDGAKSIDLSRINECPAFKSGCPYSKLHKHDKHEHTNMNEHLATEHIAKQAAKCPFFSKAHGGCPFDPNHPHAFDLSKVNECPAFKNGECPFKNINTERLQECPAFKDGKCPFSNPGAKFDLSRVHECPAFKKGCPYSALVTPTLTTTSSSAQDAPSPAQCPFSHLHGKVANPHEQK